MRGQNEMRRFTHHVQSYGWTPAPGFDLSVMLALVDETIGKPNLKALRITVEHWTDEEDTQ